MSLHADLLAQARRLVSQDPRRPRQASLRRAISTAYYALFHLLISEASAMLVSPIESIRARFADPRLRMFPVAATFLVPVVPGRLT
jgi:hypothetical protein